MASLIDANLLIRFLTGDNHRQAKLVEKLLADSKKTFVLLDLVFAEIVWVLESFYQFPREEIAQKLEIVLWLPNIKSNRRLLLQALAIYQNKNVDFIDAYLAAVSQEKKMKIYSFDRDFSKIPKINWQKP